MSGNLGDENTDPAAQPLFWISKWVAYNDKYGFGYQLCDEGIGVMFNDTTKLILLPNQMYFLHYFSFMNLFLFCIFIFFLYFIEMLITLTRMARNLI